VIMFEVRVGAYGRVTGFITSYYDLMI
jgi:hypothetical protein